MKILLFLMVMELMIAFGCCYFDEYLTALISVFAAGWCGGILAIMLSNKYDEMKENSHNSTQNNN